MPLKIKKVQERRRLKKLKMSSDIISQTTNFTAFKSATDAQTTIVTIHYRGKHFGHTWKIAQDWDKKFVGMWTFNRGLVAINSKYYPPIYHHDSLEALLQHLEETFKEIVNVATTPV